MTIGGSVVYSPPNFRGSADIGNATTESYFLNNIGAAVVLPLQNDGQWTNSILSVRLGGRVQTTTNVTFTTNVYFTSVKGYQNFATAAPIAKNTLIFSIGANTVNNYKTSYQFEIQTFWDGDQKVLEGWMIGGRVGNNILGPGTLNTRVSADPNLHNASNSFQDVFYGLCVTGLFSGSSTGNHAFLDVFNLGLL